MMLKRSVSLIFLFLALAFPALAEQGPAWVEVPEMIRPGKAVRLTFESPEAGEAEVTLLRDEDEVAWLLDGRSVSAGQTSFAWDGTDADGLPLAPGAYTLRVTIQGGSDERSILVGEEAPMIVTFLAEEELVNGSWMGVAETSMAGQLTMTFQNDAGAEYTAALMLPQGESDLTWDGVTDQGAIPAGEWEVTIRLVDDTGFSSTPEMMTVTVTRPLPAHDETYHKPNERSKTVCDHDVCFWKLNMGEMDESAIWQVLTQPVTVLKGEDRQRIKLRTEPDETCSDYVGEVTCASQAVHILEKGEEWTLVEAYSSSTEYSKTVRVWALPVQGYVKTSLLVEKEVDQEYGIVIDKLQQRLYLFKEGQLFTTLLCATGFPTEAAPFNETPAGEFIIVSWTGGFMSGNMFCDYALRINGGILLHEVPCFKDEATGKKDFANFENYLGEKASHGCVRIQRRLSPQGVNMQWLWNNLNRKPNTKVIIWDEIGRVLGSADDDYVLYYNPDGGRSYHADPCCREVNQKFWPLQPFTYGELNDAPYARLTRCKACAPQLRREEIDTVNEKNTRAGS